MNSKVQNATKYSQQYSSFGNVSKRVSVTKNNDIVSDLYQSLQQFHSNCTRDPAQVNALVRAFFKQFRKITTKSLAFKLCQRFNKFQAHSVRGILRQLSTFNSPSRCMNYGDESLLQEDHLCSTHCYPKLTTSEIAKCLSEQLRHGEDLNLKIS